MSQQRELLDDAPATATGPMRERGVTKLDIVLHTMAATEATVAEVFARVRESRRLTVADRDALSRQLAGVVGNCESIRHWLGAGAPR